MRADDAHGRSNPPSDVIFGELDMLLLGEYPLCFQMLIYPMIDDHTGTSAPDNPNTGEFIWTRSSNRFGWRSLLGKEPGGDATSEYAAPAPAIARYIHHPPGA